MSDDDLIQELSSDQEIQVPDLVASDTESDTDTESDVISNSGQIYQQRLQQDMLATQQHLQKLQVQLQNLAYQQAHTPDRNLIEEYFNPTLEAAYFYSQLSRTTSPSGITWHPSVGFTFEKIEKSNPETENVVMTTTY